MDQLEQARQIIDAVDRQMADLFFQRMKAVELVAQYKQEHGLPILNAKREQEVIAKNAAFVEDPSLQSYYVRFLQDTMAISRSYQSRLAKGMKVAYSGVEGAFAHIASSRIFPTARLLSFSDFKDAYQAVCDGECDAAVLPIENSYAGEVGQVMDLAFSGSLYISGIYELPITHHLLGLPGAKKEDIQQVVSHPQALSQCAPYIKEHGLRGISYANTAMAAQHVVETGDPALAAIASLETANLYHLEVLEKNINSSRSNTTRFAVFTRTPNSQEEANHSHFILTYTVKHEAGALVKTIQTIGKYGFNMCSMRSRPMKELLWQYYFYVEAEGDINTPLGQVMLSELETLCDQLKVCGSFKNHGELREDPQE
ncbi:MAG: chorismate mutase [Clostridia bacterium]|nr:chorismate mutase [Clostridia bacterium]